MRHGAGTVLEPADVAREVEDVARPVDVDRTRLGQRERERDRRGAMDDPVDAADAELYEWCLWVSFRIA